MEKLYFFVAQCDTWLNGDPNGYLNQYFCTEGAFNHAILIAGGVAVVAALFFYGWIGMAVNRLANLGVWLCTMLLDAVLTFVITNATVIGSSAAGTGVFHSIAEYQSVLMKQIPVDDEVGREALISMTNQFIDTLAIGCDVTRYLNMGNAVISILIFFIISICVKKLTTYAAYVPF